MEITKTIEENTATIRPEGWLDTKTTPELEEVIESLPENITGIVLDLGALEYISSAGLRQVVAIHKKMNGNLTLINTGAEILEIFKMTGFDKKLNFA